MGAWAHNFLNRFSINRDALNGFVPDIIITDPPREGMHEKVTDRLLDDALFGGKLSRIVYVSCNSATQARDLQRLDSKYRVVKYRAVDMFPHTDHVESVVLLQRR